MPLDWTDPKIKTFYADVFEEEKLQSMRWFLRHQDVVYSASEMKNEKGWREEDVLKLKQEQAMRTLTQVNKDSFRFKRKERIEGIYLDIDKLHLRPYRLNTQISEMVDELQAARLDDNTMRPCSEAEKNILVGPKPDKGRTKYLQKRAEHIPETKYYYPECTSWRHGWCLPKNNINKPTEKFRKIGVITGEGGKHNVHLNRDPDHYFVKPMKMDKCPSIYILP